MKIFTKFDGKGNYNYTSIHWQGFITMRIIARFFRDNGMVKVSRFIWRKMTMACDYCGALVGMNSTICKYGMVCELCLGKLEKVKKW